MDATRDYHTKRSKSERERQIPYDTTYMWNLNVAQMNLSTRQKQTHRHREQTGGCQRAGGWGGKDWEFGINRGKLLYIGWINNKVLLYSTGKYIQYPVTNHNRKEY